MTFFLPEECAEWTGGRWRRLPERTITSVVHDSRSMKPGALYVALRGERHDGHAFVEDAFRAGAAAAIVESSYECRESSGPLLAVADTHRALIDMARGHRDRCQARIIAITGSVGKTTVKEMLLCVLARGGRVSGTVGNWNNDIGLPLSILRMKPDDDFGVFEVAMNQPGEIAALASILRPHWAVMTTVGLAHSERFADVREIAVEKSALVTSVPEDGLAILSADEDWFDLFRAEARCRVVTVALDMAVDYTGSYMHDYPAELKITEPLGASYLYTLPLLGRHILRNALLTAAVAREAGISAADVAFALARYQPPPMHWTSTMINGVHYINDSYNANPLSMKAALQTFSQTPVEGRRWMVLAGMHELGDAARNAHLIVGSFAAKTGDMLVAVGPFGGWLAEGARRAGMSPAAIRTCKTPGDAAAELAAEVRDGDAVLLKASRAERLEQLLSLMPEVMELNAGSTGQAAAETANHGY